MPFKLNISEPSDGKSWKLENEADFLAGKKLGEKLNGKEISADLDGYELEITGASDNAGFPNKIDVDGSELKRVLLTKGWGMHKKPRKEGKKKVSTPKGLRLRKTVRGNQISDKTIQINLNVLKAGNKKLAEIFPDQNKPKEEPKTDKAPPTLESEAQPDNNQKPDETPKEDRPISETKKEEKPMEEEQKEEIKEEITEEVKEEIKEDIPESPETSTEEEKEEAAEKVAEEVAEEVEEAVEEAAEDEKKEE